MRLRHIHAFHQIADEATLQVYLEYFDPTSIIFFAIEVARTYRFVLISGSQNAFLIANPYRAPLLSTRVTRTCEVSSFMFNLFLSRFNKGPHSGYGVVTRIIHVIIGSDVRPPNPANYFMIDYHTGYDIYGSCDPRNSNLGDIVVGVGRGVHRGRG